MKRGYPFSLVAALLLLALAAFVVPSFFAPARADSQAYASASRSRTFALLGTPPADGWFYYCPNCTAGSNPCAAGGTGAVAQRIAGAWRCDGGSAATVAGAGTAGNAFSYWSGSSSLGSTAAATDGQLLIGRTGNTPQAATLTAGSGISITNGAGSVTVAATGGSSYTVYTATLTQSGSGTPTAVVHQNTLGGSVTVGRASTGTYNLERTGAFPSGKVFCTVGNSTGGGVGACQRVSDNVVSLTFFDGSGFAAEADGTFSAEIRVFS